MNKQITELLDKAIDLKVIDGNPQLLDDDHADAVDFYENRKQAVKEIIKYLLSEYD